MEVVKEFIDLFSAHFNSGGLIKLSLGKAVKSSELKNVYIRPVEIANTQQLQALYRYKTNDQTKNYSLSEIENVLFDLLGNTFLHATLITNNKEVELKFNKKREGKVFERIVNHQQSDLNKSNDRHKVKRALLTDPYLYHLGLTTKDGQLIPKMADKYRQINKYLEIFESLWDKTDLPSSPNIVDMGSGKGYLTFALYDYLNNKRGIKATVTGVELRTELVDYCNTIAAECGFKGLSFEAERIENLDSKTKIDVLIALHACDTATDDAIAKGILSDAAIIICAPCCHKQVRKQLKGQEVNSPILKYGIFKERQYEMLTDTIRALKLEEKQYKTKVFEFVSNEHTRKNVMLVGTKTKSEANVEKAAKQIDDLKKEYGLQYHYLETILK